MDENNTYLWFEYRCPIGSHISTLGPNLVALFGKTMPQVIEVGAVEKAFEHYSLA